MSQEMPTPTIASAATTAASNKIVAIGPHTVDLLGRREGGSVSVMHVQLGSPGGSSLLLRG